MGQASTNFHSLPPTCLTIYFTMLNVPVKFKTALQQYGWHTDFYIIITCNLAFVIWSHNEQIGQG